MVEDTVVHRIEILDYLSIVLSVFVIILHAAGIKILKLIKKRTGVNHLFIANFSLWCIFWAMSNLIRYPLMQYSSVNVFMYWTLVIEGGRIPFYLVIFFITIDRFLQLYLHLTYQNCFLNKYKTMLNIMICMLYVIWFASFSSI